jgi:hypothetical protein
MNVLVDILLIGESFIIKDAEVVKADDESAFAVLNHRPDLFPIIIT